MRDYKEIMSEYHNGDKKKAKEDMCSLMHRYVYSLMKEMYIPSNLFEDAYQTGIMAVLANMDNYDPDVAKPTVYFKPFIKYDIMDLVKQEKYRSSKHYYCKLEKVERSMESMEEKKESITIEMIMKHTGLTKKDTKATLEHLSRVKYEVGIEDIIPVIPDAHYSIEETAITHCEVSRMQKEIRNLEIAAQSNLISHYGLYGNKPITIKQIAKNTGQSEYEIKKNIKDSIFLLKMKMESQHQIKTTLLMN